MTGEGLLLSLGKIGLAVVVGLPLLVYFIQDSLIFHPQPIAEARRAQIARSFPAVEEISLRTPEGTRLHAWHAKGVGPLVIYFGGNAEEVSWMLDSLHETPGAGWLLVDYRGYGASEGSPSERALVADALQLYDHAAKLPGVDAQRIFVFGRSLGSGVAVQLAAQRPVRGAVLVSPYESLAAVAKRYYWYLPVDLMLKHRFDSLAAAPSLKMPLLCLIAERDEVIPPVHAERLYEAWGGPKRKAVLQAAGHNSSDSHPLFWKEIREFLLAQAKG